MLLVFTTTLQFVNYYLYLKLLWLPAFRKIENNKWIDYRDFFTWERNFQNRTICKVQLFWEGHKILGNLPQGFDVYYLNFKTVRKIAQIFVAFSEKLNFTKKNAARWTPNPLLICTWIMKNQVGKIKFDKLWYWNWFLRATQAVKIQFEIE